MALAPPPPPRRDDVDERRIAGGCCVGEAGADWQDMQESSKPIGSKKEGGMAIPEAEKEERMEKGKEAAGRQGRRRGRNGWKSMRK